MQEINVTLRSSTRCLTFVRIHKGKRICMFKAFFFSVEGAHHRAVGFFFPQTEAHKVKNVPCLHPYEVPYRNRPHPSCLWVLSEMVSWIIDVDRNSTPLGKVVDVQDSPPSPRPSSQQLRRCSGSGPAPMWVTEPVTDLVSLLCSCTTQASFSGVCLICHCEFCLIYN